MKITPDTGDGEIADFINAGQASLFDCIDENAVVITEALLGAGSGVVTAAGSLLTDEDAITEHLIASMRAATSAEIDAAIADLIALRNQMFRLNLG